MNHFALGVCATALLGGSAIGAYYGVQAVGAGTAPPISTESPQLAAAEQASADAAQAQASALPPAQPLGWSELLEVGATIAPSAKTKSLDGKRVRLIGFMAQMELPIEGAFYLVPRPVSCDEAGGGTADLMPESVLVMSRTASGRVIPFVPGALDVSGVLEIGNQPGPDGRVSAFRLRLDAGAGGARGELAVDPKSSG